MIGLSSSANAQFIGINVDYGIGYSAAPGKVSGGSVGISHPAPFIPNIGYSSVSFKDKETITDSSNSVILETTTTIKTINLFYNVPFPVVTITVGFGYGADNLNIGMGTKTTVVEKTSSDTLKDLGPSDLETSVAEVFFHIGLPLWNTIEFHLGYHLMQVTRIDITSKKSGGAFVGNYNTKKNYTGGMTTIGVQVAF